MKFDLTIKDKQIKEAREKVISKLQKTLQIKGFRVGNAPRHLTEEKVGEKAITEEILDLVLPKAYSDYIQDKKLKPITMPKINPKEVKKGEDWSFEVEIAQKPKVVLGEYKKYIKNALTKQKKQKPTEKDSKRPDHDPVLIAIFDSLLENAKCDIPALLIEEDVNQQLLKLSNQIEKLGLTLEQYITSIKTTPDKLKSEYEKTSKDNLKLEFILQQLVTDFNIKIEQKEIDNFVNSIGDEHAKTHLQSKREQEGIKYMLSKQKVVELLKSL